MANYKHVQKAVSLIATLVMVLTTVFSPVYAAEQEPPVTGAAPGISAVKGAGTLSIAMPVALIGASAVVIGWSAINESGTDYASITPGSTAISFSLGEALTVTGDTKVNISIGADVPVGRYTVTARDTTSAINGGNATTVVVLDITSPAIGTSTVVTGIGESYQLGEKLGAVTITVAAESGSDKPLGTAELFCMRPGESEAIMVSGGSAVLSDGVANIPAGTITFDTSGSYVFYVSFTPDDSSCFLASTSSAAEVSVLEGSINTINIAPVPVQSVTDDNAKFNQSAVVVNEDAFTGNRVTAEIEVSKPLRTFEATGTERETLGGQQWIGLLVTTNVDAAQLYYGTAESDMMPLGASAVQEATNLGAQGTNTFVIWTKPSDYTAENGYTISRYIQNGTSGTMAEIRLAYADAAAAAITDVYATGSDPDTTTMTNWPLYKVNQNAVWLWSNTYQPNYLNINLQGKSALQEYALPDGSSGKWVGILVTTDVKVSRLYFGSDSETMKPLTIADNIKARNYGAEDNNTFFFWVKTEEFINGSSARYIKNGESGTVVKLNLSYTPPAVGEVHISAISKEKVLDASRRNQSAVSAVNNTFNRSSEVSTAITVNGTLKSFSYSAESAVASWLGVLVSTDTDVTDLYYGDTPGSMRALTDEDLRKATALGAYGTKTFALWLDADELEEGGLAVRYIKNGANGIPVKLRFTMSHNYINIQEEAEIYASDKGSIEVTAHTDIAGAKVRFMASAKDSAGKAISASSFISLPASTLVSVVDQKAVLQYTAIKAGEVTLSAELVEADGRSFSPAIREECKITVKPSAVVTSLMIRDNSEVIPKFTLDKGIATDGTVYYGSKQLFAIVETDPNDDEHYKAVTWKSTNEKVAKVDANGLVTAVAPGSASITATTIYKNKSGSVLSKTISVTVRQHLTEASLSVGVNKNSQGRYILINGNSKLGTLVPTKLTFVNAAAKDINAYYFSSNESVATVSKDGKITAKGTGTAVITAEVSEKVATTDSGVKTQFVATMEVEVYSGLVTEITLQNNKNGCSLNDSKVSLDYLKKKTFTLSAAVNGNAYSMVAFSYTGSNSIFVKDKGDNTADITVLDSASGTGTITTSALDGSGKKAIVTVTTGSVPVSAVTIAPSDITVGVGKTVCLAASVTPSDAANKALKWVSANPAYVTVDQKGVIKGIQPTAGTEGIKVSVFATDGSGCFAEVNVKVLSAASSVAITATEDASSGITYNSKTDTVAVDLKDTVAEVQLSATVMPGTASQAVTWKSSDIRIATVDLNGKVTVNTKGSVSITATTTDGTAKVDTIKLNVIQKVYDIRINPQAKAEVDEKDAVLAKIGAPIKPAVTFNGGLAAKAPASTGYTLGKSAIPGESDGSVYVTINKDNTFTVASDAQPGYCFTVYATSAEGTLKSNELIYKIVSKQGELTAVDITAAVKQDDDMVNILLSGKSVPLAVSFNQKKSAPSGVTCTWRAYEATFDSLTQEVTYTPGQSEIKGIVSTTGVLLSKNSGDIGKYIAVEVTAKQNGTEITKSIFFKVHNPMRGLKVSSPGNNTFLSIGDSVIAEWSKDNTVLNSYNNAEWMSSNTAVATVENRDGKNYVVAQGKGTAKIIVTALDGSGVKAEVAVTVRPAAVPVNKLELNYTKIVLVPSDSLDVTATLSAKKAGDELTDNGVIWSLASVKGKDIANFGYRDDGTPVLQTVMQMGTDSRTIKVYAGSDSGTVKLTAKAKDGNGATATLDVIVADVGKMNDITLTAPKNTAAIISGDSDTDGTPILLCGKSLKLTALISPANAVNKTLAYSVTKLDGKAVTGVTVDTAGNVKADAIASSGYILVKAAATDGSGKNATIKLYVAPAVTSVRLNPMNPSAKPDSSMDIFAEAANFDSTACRIKWVSSNPAIASFESNITESGKANRLVIAKNVGTAATVAVTAYATDGSGKSATVTVKLGSPVQEIIISNAKAANPTLQDGAWSNSITATENPKILLQGKSMQFAATVNPTNAPNKAITYAVESVNDVEGQTGYAFNGVTIDNNGLLKVAAPTAKGAVVYQGFVKVTAKATDQANPVVSAPVYVYIAPATTKVSILPDTLTGEPAHFYKLSASAYGAGDYSGAIEWKSSNPAVASLNKTVTLSNQGTVTLTIAKNPGNVKSVIITATMLDGTKVAAKLTVNIGAPVTKVTINQPAKPYIHNASNLQLSAVTDPAVPITKGINWEITKGKELGVTIDANGKLTTAPMVKNGTITILAKAKDNNGAFATLQLGIEQYVTSVVIMKDSAPVTTPVEIKTNDSKGIQFTAKAAGPSDDYKPQDSSVTWSLSTADKKYADVDQTGKVTLTAEGKNINSNGKTFTVTAKANDGSGKFAAVKLTIKYLV